MARKSKKAAEEVGLPQNDFDFFCGEVGRLFPETVKVIDASEMENPAGNSTGSLTLDYDLAIPFPEGAVIEIFGDEGSYKTSLALQAVACALDAGKKCMIVNAERSLNRRHATGIRRLRPYLNEKDGRLKITTTTSGEEALNVMRMFASQFPRGVVVLDSVDACLPEAVISGAIGEQKIGNHAKLMSDALRKLVGVAHDNGVTLIFVNQMRSKITMYGDPNDTSGGRALKFYAHQRIQVMKPGKQQIITDSSGDHIGVVVRYRVVKNKYNPWGREGEIPLLYGYGFNDAEEMVKMGLNFGLMSFGGRGGRQVLLPSWKEVKGEAESETEQVLSFEEEDMVPRRREIAIKMLLNDRRMFDHYFNQLQELLAPTDMEADIGIPDTDQ